MNMASRQGITRRTVLCAAAGAFVALELDLAAVALAESDILRRKIPSSGEWLPAIGVGTGGSLRTDSPEVRAAMSKVLGALIAANASVVDTASTYGDAEQVIGAVVAADKTRQKLFIATKMEATEPTSGNAEFRQSLQRLHVSQVDLIQLHNVSDPKQSLAMLRDLKAQKLCRYIGVTSTRPGDYAAMEAIVRREKPDFMEVGYSIGDRQAEERLLPAAADAGTAVLAAQPVGGGRHTLFELVKGKELPGIAKDIGAASWGQFFLKYVLSHPAVTVAIPGTLSPDHMTDDLGAMRGPMPDAAQRKKMAAYFDTVK